MHNTIPQQIYHFQVVNNMLSPILIGFVAAFLQSLIIAFKKPSMFYFFVAQQSKVTYDELRRRNRGLDENKRKPMFPQQPPPTSPSFPPVQPPPPQQPSLSPSPASGQSSAQL